MYRELIKLVDAGKVSFKNVVTFNMDEYCNLPREHRESYHTFMWTNFFSHIDILPENVNILNGNAPDPEAECAAYEEKIRSYGGIDLFLGGVGPDGPHSVQRARLIAHLAHPHEDPDSGHHHRQLTLLRRRREPGAQDRAHRWRRHYHGRTQRAPHRQRATTRPAHSSTA